MAKKKKEFIGIAFDACGTVFRRSFNHYDYIFRRHMTKREYLSSNPKVIMAETEEEMNKLKEEYLSKGFNVSAVILCD